MNREEIITFLDNLKEAIIKGDVTTLIQAIGKMQIQTGFNDPLGGYTADVIISAISDYMKKNDIEALRVERPGLYGSIQTDSYRIVDGKLRRNGNDAKWTSLGKLYQAYKFIDNRK